MNLPSSILLFLLDERTPLLPGSMFPGIIPILSYRVNLTGRPIKKFCHDVVPFTVSDWQQAAIFEKIFMVIKVNYGDM